MTESRPPRRRRWIVLVVIALAGAFVVFTPLRAPILEFALSKEPDRANIWGQELVVGKDSVRAIRVRPSLFNGGFATQEFVQIECEPALFEKFVHAPEANLAPVSGPPILRAMVWHMSSWWPALLAPQQVYASPGFEVGRFREGEHFAGFYDDESKSIYLWKQFRW